MTDLAQAIAEIRDVTPIGDEWTARDFSQRGHASVDKHLAVVVNAVASGDLIPLADHKLAVAEAYRRAGEIAEHIRDYTGLDQDGNSYLAEDVHLHGCGVANDIAVSILSLAPTDALAEVREWKRLAIGGNLVALEMRQVEARAEAAKAELAATQAKLARVVEALKGLDRAATEVSRLGAVTGSQWSRLTVASLAARAVLEGAKPDAPEVE